MQNYYEFGLDGLLLSTNFMPNLTNTGNQSIGYM